MSPSKRLVILAIGFGFVVLGVSRFQQSSTSVGHQFTTVKIESWHDGFENHWVGFDRKRDCDNTGQTEYSKLITKSFDVQTGDRLEVNVSASDISIGVSQSNQVHIEVYADTDSENAVRSLVEDLGLIIEYSGNVVTVKTANEWYHNRNDIGIRTEIQVPAQFDVLIHTAAGDIEANDLSGNISLKSVAGDISVENLVGGTIRIESNAGDIQVGRVTGDVHLNTNAGDIDLGTAVSKNLIEINTSAGNIDAGRITTANVSVSTSAGNVTLGEITGNMQTRSGAGNISIRSMSGQLAAETGAGNVTAMLRQVFQTSATSNVGNVRILVPDGSGYTADATASEIQVNGKTRSSDSFPSTIHLNQDVNGGGPLVKVRSQLGNVTISRI